MSNTLPRVLIVDDEEEFVTTLIKRLGRRGIKCEGAFTAADGMRRAVEGEFDVAVFDVKLPDMSGIDALRALKEFQPGLGMIILTGHASASAGRDGLSAGAIEYLLKPVEFETFVERVLAAHTAGFGTGTRGSPH